jgi:hypothetical protein
MRNKLDISRNLIILKIGSQRKRVSLSPITPISEAAQHPATFDFPSSQILLWVYLWCVLHVRERLRQVKQRVFFPCPRFAGMVREAFSRFRLLHKRLSREMLCESATRTRKQSVRLLARRLHRRYKAIPMGIAVSIMKCHFKRTLLVSFQLGGIYELSELQGAHAFPVGAGRRSNQLIAR